jgi:hypothetical protein
MSKFVSFAALMLSAALMVGCENMKMGKSAEPSMDKAVVAVTNQGSVVLVPDKNGGVKTLSSSGVSASCEACKKDAMEYFSTGKPVAAHCSACGATRYPVAGAN